MLPCLTSSASISIAQILFHFTLPLWRLPNGETRGRLDTPFISHPFAKAHLIPSILQFYVDVEQTGMSSQFYDKFNIRFNISQILKSIWNDGVHRENIIKLSRNSEFFVKFVNLLRNDANYLMDECLSKLKEIGQLQTELATPPTEVFSFFVFISSLTFPLFSHIGRQSPRETNARKYAGWLGETCYDVCFSCQRNNAYAKLPDLSA